MMLRLLRSMRAVKPLCALSLHKSLHKTGLTSSLLCHSSSGLRSVSSSSKSPPSPKVKSPARPVYKAPAVRVPTLDRLQGINEDWGLELEENEVEGLRGCMRHAVEAYQRVDELTNSSTTSSFAPLAQFPRIPGGHRPSPEENYCNAWYMQTDIRGRTSTKEQQQQQLLLEGKTVAIKDTIAVAGVPMMNGSRILEGYTPIFEATVVTRVLEAGGIIKGKAVAEDLCCSASSFATALGPVRNPWKEEYAAGGSSSGCGALVGGNIVDLALGTDQGGSIRVPASWCGIVGLKPTFGLVPYTGIASHEFTLDHVGPMGRTIHDTALLLEAIAGLDPIGRDARQPPNLASLPIPKFSELATGEVGGVRVGVLREGLENCEEDVIEALWGVVEGLRERGARVEEVSVAMHGDSAAVWLPLCLEGGHAVRMEGERGFRGFYPVSLQQAYFRGFRMQAAELSCTNKYYVLFGEYVRETYGNQYYQKCQNLVPALTQAYDDLLVRQGFDVLLLPTLPIKPQLLPNAGMTPAEGITQAWAALQNTAAFDLTGHPALSVNAGFSSPSSSSSTTTAGGKAGGKAGGREGKKVGRVGGLPIGVQVVGRRWEDAMVLNVGRAIELGRGPTPLPPGRG